MSALVVRLVILVAAFASVFLLTQAGLSLWLNHRAQSRAVNRRLKLLGAGLDREVVTSLLRRNQPAVLRPDATLPEKLIYRFQQLVQTSGLSVSTRAVLMGLLLAFLGLAALLLFFAWSAGTRMSVGLVELVVGIAAAASIGLPVMVLAQLAQRRRKKMEEQFPLALDVFTRALRAGHPVAAAIDLVTRECEDPLGSEFGMVADEVAYGADLTDALISLSDRWELEDIRMFVVSLSVQSETGGNLAEILENLTKVIRDRAGLYMKVRALSSEGRMSGWMLTGLPIFTIVSVFLASPGYYFEVADDPIFQYGYAGLITLYFIGVYTIRRMIDLRV